VVVDTFKHWRHYCDGATHHIQVFSDHQNLEYFTTTKVLNQWQVRWAQELAGIDFNLLPTRNPEWQARCIIQAFGVPPGKVGGGKPADYNNFAGETPRLGKPQQKKECLVHLLVGSIGLATSKEMAQGIPKESPGRLRKGCGLSRGKKGSGVGGTDLEGPKGQGQDGGSKRRTPIPEKPTLGTERNGAANPRI